MSRLMRNLNGFMIGLVLIAGLAYAMGAKADNEDSAIGNTAPKPTDPAIMVELTANAKEMTAMRVLVPHVSDGIVLLCFRSPDKVNETGCFYVNAKTHQVVYIQVKTNELDT